MAVRLDEAEKQILARLMADFSERALSSNQLSSGYVGPLISDLATAICVCVGGERSYTCRLRYCLFGSRKQEAY